MARAPVDCPVLGERFIKTITLLCVLRPEQPAGTPEGEADQQHQEGTAPADPALPHRAIARREGGGALLGTA